MSQICVITLCKRPSCALCHCCQQNVCLPHLKEHQDSLISQLNPLVDQINGLCDRLKAVSSEDMIGDARQKLEQWRMDSHKKIDDFYKQKGQELDRCITKKLDKQQGEIEEIQSKLSEHVREQYATRDDLDLLVSALRDLERQMNKIEQTSFSVKSQFLHIDESWIVIEELNRHRLDLSTLPPVYKSTEYTNGSFALLASNDRFLLMHQEPNLCLVDRDLTVVKQGLWNHDGIRDMCWSSVLDRFIVIDANNVFLIDQHTMSAEIISTILTNKWLSGTCSEKSLFLSILEFSSSIMEYSLLPSIQLLKHWKSPDTCQEDEVINHMRNNNETLGIMITKPSDGSVYIELRTSKTLDRLWSLRLDIENVQKKVFCCCVINKNEWLVVDHKTHRLIQITNDGKMKATCAYKAMPWCPNMFGHDILGISTTNEGINFHKL